MPGTMNNQGVEASGNDNEWSVSSSSESSDSGDSSGVSGVSGGEDVQVEVHVRVEEVGAVAKVGEVEGPILGNLGQPTSSRAQPLMELAPTQALVGTHVMDVGVGVDMDSVIKAEEEAGRLSPMETPRKRRTCAQWCRKYFLAGQIKDVVRASRGPPPPGHWWLWNKFVWERPHWVTVVLPLTIVYSVWLAVMIKNDMWWVFGDLGGGVNGYYMTIMMVFGSFVAGATSEGGGSVAYPIMTLAFGLKSSVARDFSLMIQSIGMTSASFTILYSQIQIEHTALKWGGGGGVVGVVLGLLWMVEHVPDKLAKMIFVSVWLSFAANLFLLNRRRKRMTLLTVEQPTRHTKAVLFSAGVIGGGLAALSGSGADVTSACVMLLMLSLSEKTATPTSVVIMSMCTVAGFATRVATGGITTATWQFWAAAVPAVCVGAPVGAFVSSFVHRQVLASFVYFTDVSQFIAACLIEAPDTELSLITVATVIVSFVGFYSMSFVGRRNLTPLGPGHGIAVPLSQMVESRQEGSHAKVVLAS